MEINQTQLQIWQLSGAVPKFADSMYYRGGWSVSDYAVSKIVVQHQF